MDVSMRDLTDDMMDKFDEYYLEWLHSQMTPKLAEEMEWLRLKAQIIQTMALAKIADRRNW